MGPGRWIGTAATAATLVALAGCSSQAPDASRTLSRERVTSGEVVPEAEVRVAEYLNYYDQRFPEPAEGQVGLDLRLGNGRISTAGGRSWLQVGLQARSDRVTDIAPLNLALVVDTSGSMADDEKIRYVKEGLRRFLASLAPNDRVSLVQFGDQAEVLVTGRPVEDGGWILEAVERLRTDGRTNLHAGLMAGLEAVASGFDTRRNNAVILLTDGIANVGETDPQRIAEAVKGFTARGIQVHTIGLGADVQDSLLSELSRQSQGGYHYIDRPQELDRVFQDTVSGLFQEAAADVAVTLVPAPGVRLVSVTGYDGLPPAGPVTVALRDMGTGDSQVLLAELDLSPRPAGPAELAEVRLGYRDQIGGGAASQVRMAMADAVGTGDGDLDPLWDTEVLRNVTIQQSAEGLKEIDRLYRDGQFRAAWDLAYRLEQDLRRTAALTGEAEMQEDADLMRRYQDTLAGRLGELPGRGVDAPGAPAGARWPGREPTLGAPVLETR